MAEKGLRWVYVRVKHLPMDAALWRDQGRIDPSELMHEWAQTLVMLLSGKRVRTPTMVRSRATDVQRTRKRKIIESLRDVLRGSDG